MFYNLKNSEKVLGDKSLSDYLHSMSGIYFGKSDKLDALINAVPDFQISVPVGCDDWDVENYEPLVSYVPSNFDESAFKYVKAYDSEGNVHLLPLDKTPSEPVIVLGSCERMDYLLNDKRIEEIDPIDNGGGGSPLPPNPAPPAPPTPSSRVSGQKEYIAAIKLENISVVESWILGKPELMYNGLRTLNIGWVAS